MAEQETATTEADLLRWTKEARDAVELGLAAALGPRVEEVISRLRTERDAAVARAEAAERERDAARSACLREAAALVRMVGLDEEPWDTVPRESVVEVAMRLKRCS